VGNFTFQVVFEGQTFPNGAVYKPSSASAVLVVPGTPRPKAEADGGSWAAKASMSEARGGLGVVALNGKIYAIGGEATGPWPPTSVQFLSTNEEYDPVTDTWALKKSMPTPRTKFAIAAVQGRAYCIGGVVGVEAYSTFPNSGTSGTGTEPSYTLVNFVHYRNILTDVNEAYDPATDTWETKAPLPRNMTGDTANVVNGKIYVVSGTETYIYDPAQDSWATAPSTPAIQGSYVSAVIGNKIYFLSSDRPVVIYEPETDTWRTGAYTPVMEISGPAGATTGVSARRRAYLFGIEPIVANQQESRTREGRRVTFVYDLYTDIWVAGAQILTYRRDFGIANINDKLYLIGGDDSAVNEQYTPSGYGNVPPPSNGFPSETEPPTDHAVSPEAPIATPIVIASAASVAGVTAGLLVYVRKRKHRMKT
jgi:hypothetical protein